MKKLTFDQIQKPIIKTAKKWLQEKNRPTVLAAAPGSGKTFMSYLIAKFFKKKGIAVLVMGHSTTLLKEQYYHSMVEYETKGDSKKPHGIRLLHQGTKELERFWHDRENMSPKSKDYPWMLVGIPQSVVNADYDLMKKFDMVITDECHQNYLAESYGIAQTLNPKYDLGLTGTPSKFIYENEQNPGGYNLITLPAEELRKNGLLDEPMVELALSSVDFRKTDYGDTDQLTEKATKKLTKKATNKDMATLIDAIVAQLSSDEKVAKELKGKGKTKAAFDKIGKTMIACRRQVQAKAVRDYLESKGVKCYLSISGKGEDQNSVEIQNFVKDKTGPRVLIVVGRGILGLNDPSIINIIDMAYSMNPDTILQLMARLFRKMRLKRKVNGKSKKLFIKLVPKELEDVARVHTSFAIAMMFREVFETYNGKYSSMITPTENPDEETKGGNGSSGEKKEGEPPRPKLHDYGFLEKVFKKYRDGVETVAMRNVRDITGIGGYRWTEALAINVLKAAFKNGEFKTLQNLRTTLKGGRLGSAYNWIKTNKKSEALRESIPELFKQGSKWTWPKALAAIKEEIDTGKYKYFTDIPKGTRGRNAHGWIMKNKKLYPKLKKEIPGRDYVTEKGIGISYEECLDVIRSAYKAKKFKLVEELRHGAETPAHKAVQRIRRLKLEERLKKDMPQIHQNFTKWASGALAVDAIKMAHKKKKFKNISDIAKGYSKVSRSAYAYLSRAKQLEKLRKAFPELLYKN